MPTTSSKAVDSLDDGSGYVSRVHCRWLPNNLMHLRSWTVPESRLSSIGSAEGKKSRGSTSTYVVSSQTRLVGRCQHQIPRLLRKIYLVGTKVTVTVGPNLKILKVNVASGDKTVSFVATVTLPAQRAFDPDVGAEVVTGVVPPTYEDGYPVLIVIGFLGEAEKRYLNDHGYAVIEYDNNTRAADNASRTGVFYELYPYGKTWDTQTGVLLAWSWGVSKIIDAIENDARGARELNISPVNTIVTGVSRNGKAAVAGAFEPDQR